MSYVDILHTFLVRRKKIARFSSGSGKLTVSHIFAPLSSQMLSYTSIYVISIESYCTGFHVDVAYFLSDL